MLRTWMLPALTDRITPPSFPLVHTSNRFSTGDGVFQRPDDGPEAGHQRLVGQGLPGRLGDAEVDHLGHRLAVVRRDEDIGGLYVAVDDALLMSVLHRLADGDEQLQPLPGRQVVVVAEAGDRPPPDQ